MKFIDMVADIKDYLDLIDTTSDQSTQAMAEYILLGCCEQRGMKPPAQKGIHDFNRDDQDLINEVYSWETKDEA